MRNQSDSFLEVVLKTLLPMFMSRLIIFSIDPESKRSQSTCQQQGNDLKE